MSKFIKITRDDIVLIFTVIAIGIVISWLIYDNLLPGVLAVVFISPAKTMYERYRTNKMTNEMNSQFNDFLYYVSASFTLGRNMIQSMEEATNNLTEIYGENALLIVELRHILEQNENSNVSDIELLSDLANRYENEDIQDFVKVYSTCKKTGGDMPRSINLASKVISEKISITREISLISSQRKLEGRIIATMPFLIIFFLKVTGPAYLEPMYCSVAGRLLMTLALGLIVLSIILMEKITKVRI